MKHKIKALVILLAVLGGVVLALFLVTRFVHGSSGQAASVEEYQVTDYSAEKISAIQIQNLAGETYAIALNGSLASASIVGMDAAVPLDQVTLTGAAKALTQCVSYCEPIPVTQDSLSEYGLDAPKASFTICFQDGTKTTLYMGNETVTKNGYYLWEKGKDQAYVVENAYETYAGFSAWDYITKVLTQINQDDRYKISELSLYNKERNETLGVAQKTEASSGSDYSLNTYEITSPVSFDALDENLKSYLFNQLENFCATGVSSLDCTEENLSKLGFDDPDYILSFTSDSDPYTLRFARQEDGTVLTMLNDIPVVYTISADAAAFLDTSLDQIVSPFLTLQGITDLDRFVVDTSTEQYAFTLSGGEDSSSDLAVSYQGKALSTDSFRKLYSRASKIFICGMAESQPTDTLVLRLSYERRDGETHTVEFYRMDGRYCFAVCDGEGRFKVRLSEIEYFLEGLQTCIQGGELTA